MTGRVEEGRVRVDGVEAFYRRVDGDGTPVVYCHGNPTHSEDWLPFMERGGPSIAIDMPGWGRSERPDPARFDYTMHGLSAFLERCLEELGVGPRKLVVHDWGSLALIGAQRRPQLVERLVVVNAVPLFGDYRWHWVAQLWRRRPLGEALNASMRRSTMALALRQARGDHRSAMPADFVDSLWRHWDAGTRRAILRLYRDADPDRLAAAGAGLAALTCPALVVWGARDAYIAPRFGAEYAAALPGAELEIVAGAGHWPWIDRPALIDRIAGFVA